MRPPKYLGVYSFASAKADGPRKALFFIWELAPQEYAVQQLDKAFQPTGMPERVSAAYFADHFRSEPSILAMPMTTLDIRLLGDRPEARGSRTPPERFGSGMTPALRTLEAAAHGQTD